MLLENGKEITDVLNYLLENDYDFEKPNGKRTMSMLSPNKHSLFEPKGTPKERYYKNYADIQRFISYFYQINSAMTANPRTILEVGVGNKIVSNYLTQSGYKVTTFDINKNLEPEVVGDLRNLPFKESLFDVVLAFEILEHIPFKDVSKSLAELRRVSQKNVILSIPYSSFFTESIWNVKTPFFSKQMRFFLSVPFFTSDFAKTNEHHWEMGRRNYPRKKVRRLLEKYFKIQNEFQPVLNPYHYFYILEKIANRVQLSETSGLINRVQIKTPCA